MIISTRKRLEAIIAILDGPVVDPDSLFLNPERTLEDIRQIWTMCKNALLEDPVGQSKAIDYTTFQDVVDFLRDLSILEKTTDTKLPVKITVEVDIPPEFTETAKKKYASEHDTLSYVTIISEIDVIVEREDGKGFPIRLAYNDGEIGVYEKGITLIIKGIEGEG